MVSDGEVTGAVAYHLGTGAPVVIAAKATVLATGGLTRLYRRNSASANMGGDGYALALRAGASLIDMEFVQFFPIGHLAPRLIGMDPIMWDPFRYKLGGRLLNGRMEEFTSRYGSDEDGKYVLTRDLATYAILKEVEAGRGSPHGGAYLSFEHCSPAALRAAFGPVIDRLAANGIDLTRMPVEVAPIAHYHMGGVKADASMATRRARPVRRRRSGRRRQRRQPAVGQCDHRSVGVRPPRRAQRRRARQTHARSRKLDPQDTAATLDLLRADAKRRRMSQHRGADRAAAGHHGGQCRAVPHRRQARPRARRYRGNGRASWASSARPRPAPSICERLEWFDLRNMLLVAHAVAASGAQRAPKAAARISARIFRNAPQWQVHQTVRWRDGALQISGAPAAAEAWRHEP